MPRPLDVNRLSRFEPRKKLQEANMSDPVGQGTSAATPELVDAEPRSETKQPLNKRQAPQPEPTRWRSREPVVDGQISIKAPLNILERFKYLCASDRRTYAAMLEILMDSYDTSQK